MKHGTASKIESQLRPHPRVSRSGIPLKDFCGAPDGKHRGSDGATEKPGKYPFTRGRSATAKPVGGWIQRELSGEGDPERSNQQFRFLIGKGQTGLDVIGDSPTQSLMDPDHPLSERTVGTQGVSISCKPDFLELLQGLPFERITISTSVPSLFALSGLVIATREMGFPLAQLRGSVLQVPFYAEDVTYAVHIPFDGRVRLSCDVMEFCAAHTPRFHSFIEDTYYFSESGLDAVEEMALGFVEIRHLVREMLRRGVDIDAFAPRIAILVNCSMDFFEEIAKIRATRRIFARMMRDEFGAKDPRSWSVVVTSHTSGLTLTAQQPINNVVRGTLQTLSLVLAGAHAIEVSTFDEAFRTPSEAAHVVGLRTQQIIELESGVTKVVDPLGGSYYVEELTDELERRILAMIHDIETRGSPAELFAEGWFRRFFEERITRHFQRVESGEQLVVGVNVHESSGVEDRLLREEAEAKIAPHRGRVEKIRAFKAQRPLERTRAALHKVREGTAGGTNLVPVVIEALDANATLGEIMGTIRQGYGGPYDPYGLVQPII